MQITFKKNYLKIYFWKGISVILNLISMFIVLPYLSSQPVIFGIYSLIISFTIFYNYGDIGFLSAGYKYCAEYYAQNNLKKEIEIVGFVSFILVVFTILFSLILIIISNYPTLLIKGLSTASTKLIASHLLLILGIFSFVFIFRRILQVIFCIRLEDYVQQKILIVFSIFKIISVLYFFKGQKYDIIGYFLFVQFMNLLALIISLIVVKIRYKYDVIYLIKNIRFSKKIYYSIKSLAFSALYISFCWFLFYELDSLVISKFFGAKSLAVYAIGFTIATFLRNIFSILYSPFNARFNHLVGLNKYNELRQLVRKILITTSALTIFPIISIIILMKPLIISWVGTQYTESIPIALLLVLYFLFSFINYPAGSLLVALKKIKSMYIIATMNVIIFWLGIVLTINIFNIYSFPIFKFVSSLIVVGFYFNIIKGFLKIEYFDFFKNYIFPIIVPIITQILFLLLILPALPILKSSINLLIIVVLGSLSAIIATIVCLITSKTFNQNVVSFYKEVSKKLVAY